ncbi:CKLF-like MARVEL transmembrane domain-containing protein 7 [Lethenteron reissneri]|uniref:CKLF-like MARVEL transmembrane domain-containing protein 7 n=1 Tax=Lethenteron reissneri TaxID=7753 RepID=UPI002AB60FD1|nr:CKLF-like MARVEL transmembrane domain-containing protein 7 [Lethenteron reissneri]XP_061421633.1 CKLF-like MARVEL transmembrane domain-containing protein 7 [Lethenteron reissneri]
MSDSAAYTPTTTAAASGGQNPGLVDKDYPRTLSGLLKIVQMVLVFVAFLCISCSRTWTNYSALRYFETTTLWFFFTVLILFIIFLFRLHKRITFIHWPLTELIHYVISFILLLIASITVAANAGSIGSLIVGTIFGFLATGAYGFGAWFTYRSWRMPAAPTASV